MKLQERENESLTQEGGPGNGEGYGRAEGIRISSLVGCGQSQIGVRASF